MRQSTRSNDPRGLHVAIIMDGNGRWATARGLPRLAGHRAGADAVRRVVENAPDLGIRTLTLYAFSSDNWSRPTREVRGLLKLLAEYLGLETPTCVKNGVRLSAIGRRDRFPSSLVDALEASEHTTRRGRTLDLRLALDYSSRDVLARAAAWLSQQAAAGRGGEPLSPDVLERALAHAMHAEAAPAVDVLVRTGGEKRLSDFMLWESAYAELFFSDTMWPEFQVSELSEVIDAFHRRERRFGGLPDRAAS